MANRNALWDGPGPERSLPGRRSRPSTRRPCLPRLPRRRRSRSRLGRMAAVSSGWSAGICCSFAGASSALVAVSRSPAKASPSPGKGSPGAAAAKWSWSWAAGDAAGNPEYVNQEALMIEPEVLKELRIIVAKVAHADQASGRAPAHVLQAKEKVREELVSAVREKYEAYLATAN